MEAIVKYKAMDGTLFDTENEAAEHERKLLAEKFENMSVYFDIPFKDWSDQNDLCIVKMNNEEDYETMIAYLKAEINDQMIIYTECPKNFPCMKILSVQDNGYCCSFPDSGNESLKKWSDPYLLANELFKCTAELFKKAKELEERN